jgi:hypothetical protein
LPKPSLLERYTNIFIVWTISGFFHGIQVHASNRGSYLGTMFFFQSFAIATMIEDGAQELYRRCFGEGDGTVSWWKKCIGFLWVCAFISLVAPLYIYPTARAPASFLPNRLDRYNLTDRYGAGTVGSLLLIGHLILKAVFKAGL